MCQSATRNKRWETNPYFQPHIKEAKKRGLNCKVDDSTAAATVLTNLDVKEKSADSICKFATNLVNKQRRKVYEEEARRRGLNCAALRLIGVKKMVKEGSSSELVAVKKRADELEKS